mgnify:CR=1 FL=1
MSDYAQTAYDSGGYGQGPFDQLFSALVPVLASGLVLAIPGGMAVFLTILHVTFWRRDNRAMGGEAFSHREIKAKVLTWGRVYGVGTVAVMQGLVEFLLRQELSWYLRGCMVVVALVATGPVSRFAFDWIRGYAAGKAEDGSRRWLRIYNYLTVEHAKAANGTDDTFFIQREDTTEPKKP